jgi:hypothetical protein
MLLTIHPTCWIIAQAAVKNQIQNKSAKSSSIHVLRQMITSRKFVSLAKV